MQPGTTALPEWVKKGTQNYFLGTKLLFIAIIAFLLPLIGIAFIRLYYIDANRVCPQLVYFFLTVMPAGSIILFFLIRSFFVMKSPKYIQKYLKTRIAYLQKDTAANQANIKESQRYLHAFL